MIEMNTRHKDFDLDMEVLCTLPLGAPGALTDTIEDDFGLKSHNELVESITRIRACGHSIHLDREKRPRRVWIRPRQSGHTINQCRKYWKNVYGD